VEALRQTSLYIFNNFFHSYMQQKSLTLKHLPYWQQYRYSTYSLRSLTLLSSRSST